MNGLQRDSLLSIVTRRAGPEHRRAFSALIAFILGGAVCTAVRAGADMQWTAEHEARGLWVVRTSMTTRESVERLVERAAKGNFNALFVQVNGRGEAYYESNFVPKMPDVGPDFDPLAFCIEKAHAVRIQVHAWINAFTVGKLGCREYETRHVLARHPEWALVDEQGVSTFDYAPEMARDELVSVMLDPAIEGVKEYVHDVFMEVVRNYDVDGIHFDYIRYPGTRFGYGEEARAAFRDVTGQDPLELVSGTETSGAPDGDHVYAGPRAKWDAFRREQVTEVVRRVYEDVKREKPEVAVSCAVFPDVEDAFTRRLQDWKRWLLEGIVDFVVPMAYTSDTMRFNEQIGDAVEVAPGRRVLAGVGAYNMLDDVAGCIEKIASARRVGARGVVLFSYDAICDRMVYWETLSQGPFRVRAAAPVMAWASAKSIGPP